MVNYALLLLVFLACSRLSAAQCGIDEYRCCLTEFIKLISNSTGIQLTDDDVHHSCKVYDDTITCIDDFEATCGNITQIQTSIPLKSFLTDMCSMSSEFNSAIKESEKCLVGSSERLRECIRKQSLPNFDSDKDSNWKAECCEYRSLKNCAIEAVDKPCGTAAKDTLMKELTNVNGAGLESACSSIFDQCDHSSASLTSSALYVVLICVFAIVSMHSYT